MDGGKSAFQEAARFVREGAMNRNTAWMCLGGGVILFVLGVQRLWQQGDWALLILSVLIGAFSISALMKHKTRK